MRPELNKKFQRCGVAWTIHNRPPHKLSFSYVFQPENGRGAESSQKTTSDAVRWSGCHGCFFPSFSSPHPHTLRTTDVVTLISLYFSIKKWSQEYFGGGGGGSSSFGSLHFSSAPARFLIQLSNEPAIVCYEYCRLCDSAYVSLLQVALDKSVS